MTWRGFIGVIARSVFYDEAIFAGKIVLGKKCPRNDTFLYCILFFLILSGCSSQTSQMQTHFQKASDFYKKGDYAAAIKEYEQIVSKRLASPAVYYNLGNSYFKNNQLGKAVLYYERASFLVPRDADVRANLNYARGAVVNFEPETTEGWRRIFVHMGRVSVNEITGILVFLAVVGGAIFVAGLFLGWPRRKVLAVLIFFGCLFIFHYVALVVKIQAHKNQAVILVDTPARFEPEDDATIHYQTSQGWKVKVIEESGGWSKVMRIDGKQGWTPKYTLEKI